MPMFQLSRRSLLSGLGAASLLTLPRPSLAAESGPLTIWGPPAGPSITVAHAIAAGLLKPVAEKAELRLWRSPDEMRAGLTSGSMQLVIMPTATAANLYNRGLGVRLVNVMTNGLLYIIAPVGTVADIEGLKGKRLALPFSNDMPAFIVNRLLRANGLTPGADLAVETAGTPLEAVQMLLMGRVDAAVVAEPSASMAIIRGGQMGRQIARAVDLQEAWAGIAGSEDRVLPQAGLAVTDKFCAADPGRIDAIAAILEAATLSMRSRPAEAAAQAAPMLEMPAPVIEQAIGRSNLVATRARTARPSLERLFDIILKELDPAILGGRLPAADFYL